MSVATKVRPLAVADLKAIPEDARFHEIIDGELVRKATPSGPHGLAQLAVGARIRDSYSRRPGGRQPGGWWIMTEVEIELDLHEVYRPDVAGWRRERMAEVPRESPISLRPDWVCEVLSPTNARNDLVKKMRGYHRTAVPHYWVVDPEQETLTVYRWTVEGYLVALTAQREERVRAEPFGEVELSIGALFGGDEEE